MIFLALTSFKHSIPTLESEIAWKTPAGQYMLSKHSTYYIACHSLITHKKKYNFKIICLWVKMKKKLRAVTLKFFSNYQIILFPKVLAYCMHQILLRLHKYIVFKKENTTFDWYKAFLPRNQTQFESQLEPSLWSSKKKPCL